MKIILVGQYYWPENFLINEIAEDLVLRGHEVTVLTGLPDYATNYVPKEFKNGKRRHEIHNGVEIIRVPIIARHTGFLYRVLNYISFMLSSSFYACMHKIEADVIMAYQTAPVMMGQAGIVLKNKLKKPLFFYCLDIWPDQMKVWNVREKNPIFHLVKRYCQYAYGSADVLGITSEPFRRYMVDVNRVNPNKIVYVPQHSERMNIECFEKNTDTIDLIFAGNIGQQQDVECILRAVSLIKTKKKYHVHIYGNGTAFEKCQKLAADLNITEKVTFYGRVSKERLSEVYPKMDAFLLTLCGEDKMGFATNTVPAKFQGYLSAGKPILAAIDGCTKDIIDEIKCGKAVKSSDYIGFSNIITDFIENVDRYASCGRNGMRYFDMYYDKKVVMNQIENILKGLSKK